MANRDEQIDHQLSEQVARSEAEEQLQSTVDRLIYRIKILERALGSK